MIAPTATGVNWIAVSSQIPTQLCSPGVALMGVLPGDAWSLNVAGIPGKTMSEDLSSGEMCYCDHDESRVASIIEMVIHGRPSFQKVRSI